MAKVTTAIFALFFLLYILPLGARPMVIPDETRYAEIGREMVETGDWVVPRLNGLRYFEKPILGHWLHASTIKLLGANAFAIRLPSALAVGLSALMLFFLVRRFTGDASAAIVAASIFLTCLEVYGVGTFCVLDSMFSMLITASVIALFFAFMEARLWRRTVFLIVSGIACGLAFLTKGFLALVIPMIVIIPFVFWQGQFKTFLRTAWVPLVTTVLVGLPWSVMIHLREPDFWHYFFWVEHVNRFISPNGDQHPYPFWFYIPIIIGGVMPWTLLVGPVVQGLRHTGWKDPMIRLAICWLGLPFLFFSASSGKLGTYILPCFPPLAILTSTGLLKYSADGKRKAFTVPVYSLAAVVAALVILLILNHAMPAGSRLYEQQETWKVVLVTIAFLTWVLLLLCAGRAADFRKMLAYFAVSPAVFMFCVHFVIPGQLMEKKTPGEFLRQHKHRVNRDTILVSDNYLTSAVCWSYKRDDVRLLGRAGEFAYGLAYDDSKHRLLDIDQFKDLIATDSGEERIALITSTKRYVEYRQLLPRPVFEDIDHGFVFAEFAARSASIAAIHDPSPSQRCRP